MTFDEIAVLFVGVSGIGFTLWFFFGKKEDVVSAHDAITIEVTGGYRPAIIALQKGKKTTITFHRTDPSSCLEEVVLPDFKIRKFLPLDKNVTISLTPEKAGEFPFACGMNMFHGKIVVEG